MTHEITATVRLLVSDSRPKECICCPDQSGHVYGINLDLPEFPTHYPAHFGRDVDLWLRSIFDLKVMDGQTIKITAEVVPKD